MGAVFTRSSVMILYISAHVDFITPIRSLCPMRLFSPFGKVGCVPNTVVEGMMPYGPIMSFIALVT